jgi:hypothetical protein
VPVISYLKFLEITDFNIQLKEDLRDSWTAPNNQHEAQRILDAIFLFSEKSPQTKIALLCGDVHVATVGQIQSVSSQRRIDQIVSSGIGSPPPYGIVRMLLKWAAPERVEFLDARYKGSLRKLLSPEQDHLLAKRNFVILQVGDELKVEFFADYKSQIIRFIETL